MHTHVDRRVYVCYVPCAVRLRVHICVYICLFVLGILRFFYLVIRLAFLRSFHRRRAQFFCCWSSLVSSCLRCTGIKQRRAELSRQDPDMEQPWHKHKRSVYTCDICAIRFCWPRLAGRVMAKWKKTSERETHRDRDSQRAAGKPEHKSQIRLMFIKNKRTRRNHSGDCFSFLYSLWVLFSLRRRNFVVNMARQQQQPAVTT